MKKYSFLIFIFFTGIEPMGFLTMGIIPITGFDTLVAFIVAIVFPWVYYGVSFKNGILRRQIVLIISIVIFRFALDAFITDSFDLQESFAIVQFEVPLVNSNPLFCLIVS